MSWNRCPTLSAAALAGAFFAPVAAHAVETRVMEWTIDKVPFWESPGGTGQFGGYLSGRFEIAVTGDTITVRGADVLGRSFSGPSGGSADDPWAASHRAEASRTNFSVAFDGPADSCDLSGESCIRKYWGSFGIVVDGDLTGPANRLPVVGGGFNYWEGHYDWYYGSFGPGGYVVREVPEPSTTALLAAGLLALGWRVRKRRP